MMSKINEQAKRCKMKNEINMQNEIVKYSVVSLIKGNLLLLLVFFTSSRLESTSKIQLHQKFSREEENIFVALPIFVEGSQSTCDWLLLF